MPDKIIILSNIFFSCFLIFFFLIFPLFLIEYEKENKHPLKEKTWQINKINTQILTNCNKLWFFLRRKETKKKPILAPLSMQ